MKVKKCPICSAIFPDAGFEFCPECTIKVDDQFSAVRDYLYDHPNAPIEEVAEATEVPHKVIVSFLKEGRLRIVSGSGLLRCEQCGAAIDSGRFCEKCSKAFDEKMVKPFLDAQKRMREPQAGPRMHTSKRD